MSFKRQTKGACLQFSACGAAAWLVVLVAVSSPASARDDRMTPIAPPAQSNAIILGTGPLPGAMAPEAWHSQYGSVFARNVTVATLTPFLPCLLYTSPSPRD